MILLPFLSAFLLLLNPALLAVFRKMDLNLQKFQFWAMLTSGVAWVISLAAFLVRPEVYQHASSGGPAVSLPGFALALDGTSSALILGAAGIVFYESLKGADQPRDIARITGLGGICILGLLSDSAYTLLFGWTLLEGILLLFAIHDRPDREILRRKYLAILLRLACPLIMVYLALIRGGEEAEVIFSDLPVLAGPLLVLAGSAGFVGWMGLLRPDRPQSGKACQGLNQELLPGILGLMLIVRGGGAGSGVRELLPLSILSGLALGAVAVGILFGRSNLAWIAGGLGLVAGSALAGLPEESLTWGLVYLLPGLLLRDPMNDQSEGILALIAGLLGVLFLPFLPAWSGVELFSGGFQGLVFAVLYGLAAGGSLAEILERIRAGKALSAPPASTRIVGAGVLLLSLVAVSVSNGLIPASLALLSAPLAGWLPAPLLILLGLLGSKLPRVKTAAPENALSRAGEFFAGALDAAARLIDMVVSLLSGLFEGEGGLIWALLTGFLIITLISIRGG